MLTTSLPKEMPDRLLLVPTMNRWAQSLPRLLASVNQTVGDDVGRYGVIIADGTPSSNITQIQWRQNAIDKLPISFRKALFILDQVSQSHIVEKVVEATTVRREIVEAYLSWTGYGSQRAKLDVVAGAFARKSPIKVLTLDDDVEIPSKGVVLDPSHVAPGLRSITNSQTIVAGPPPPAALTEVSNSLESFFGPLGSDVSVGMVASEELRDTMHEALETAQRTRRATQFEVSQDNSTTVVAPTGRIIATAATKYGIPDYRTIKIAEANLRDNFPPSEVEFESFVSGPTEPFLFRRATTNVDSACIARLLDERTSQIGWWLVTNTDISLKNPLKTVTTSYRADNELLPGLLDKVASANNSLWYQGGIETHIIHRRERAGARPDIIEQATASLIGHIVAQAVLSNLAVDPATMRTTLSATNHYAVPEGLARSVFEQLSTLAKIALEKRSELKAMLAARSLGDDASKVADLIGRFETVFTTIRSKTGNFNFTQFYGCTNQEVKAQLDFYREVLEAAPQIGEAVGKLVQNGLYPVLGGIVRPPRVSQFGHRN